MNLFLKFQALRRNHIRYGGVGGRSGAFEASALRQVPSWDIRRPSGLLAHQHQMLEGGARCQLPHAVQAVVGVRILGLSPSGGARYSTYASMVGSPGALSRVMMPIPNVTFPVAASPVADRD